MGVKIPLKEGEPAKEISDGEHAAKLTGVAYLDVFEDGSTPKGGPQVEWYFDVETDEGEWAEIRVLSSAKWVEGTKPSKLTRWSGRLGLERGAWEDTDNVVGRDCRVIVAQDANGFPRISDVLGPKAVKVKA